MAQSSIGLRGAGQLDRRTHFETNGLGDLANTALKNLRHPLEHTHALFHRGLAKGFKRGFGCGHRQIDVGF